MSLLRTRRRLITGMFAAGVGGSLVSVVSAQDAPATAVAAEPVEERYLELFNTHTHETLKVVYKRGADYDSAALASLNQLLRDRRNGDMIDMDPRLYDQLFELARAAKVDPHYEIISGFRSQESNDKMSSRPGSGVARKSLHMQGRAIDVRLKNCPTATLRDLALAAKKGGVGYYQRSDFVHIDTGNFRTWVG
jgi:uncharacterized protein YcbK (DUF882 family)